MFMTDVIYERSIDSTSLFVVSHLFEFRQRPICTPQTFYGHLPRMIDESYIGAILLFSPRCVGTVRLSDVVVCQYPFDWST